MENFLESVQKHKILADGAMGTYLKTCVPSPPSCLESLVLTNPAIIFDIHKEYFEAGSRLIYTHTFGANHLRLKQSQNSHKLENILDTAVKIIKPLKNKGCFIAGNIGPSGLSEKDLRHTSQSQLIDNFFVPMQFFSNSNSVDVIACETLTNQKEIEACILAYQKLSNSNLPLLLSLSPNSDGKLYDGGTLQDILEYVTGKAQLIGINCFFGPQPLQSLVKTMQKYDFLGICLKPNSGYPEALNANEFSNYMYLLINDCNILGGCCGTTPQHILKLANLVAKTSKNQ